MARSLTSSKGLLISRWMVFLPLVASTIAHAPAEAASEIPGKTRGTPVRWKDLVQEASRGNPDIRAARERWQAAQLSQRGAFSSFLPAVTLSTGLNYGSSGQSMVAGGVVLAPAQAQRNYTFSAVISQNLFNGLQDQARVAQARAAQEVARADWLQARVQASYDLKSAYASLLYAQTSIQIQKQIQARRDENHRLVELRFESGRENKGSVLLSEAYLAQAKYETSQAAEQLLIARAQLARVLGQPEESGEDFSLSESPADLPPETSVSSVRPDLRALVLATPQHERWVAQESQAEAAIRLARGGFFPTLNLSCNSHRSGSEWFPGNPGWTLGASLSWSIFSGGRDYYSTRGAAASWRAASATLSGGDQELRATLQRAESGLRLAIEKLSADQKFFDAARVRADIARNKYNNGLLTFDAWDIIENDLIARQRALLLSRRDRLVAEAEWERARGVSVLP